MKGQSNHYFNESEDIRLRREQLKSIGNEIILSSLISMGVEAPSAIKEHSLQMDMTIAYATELYLQTIRKGINRIKFGNTK